MLLKSDDAHGEVSFGVEISRAVVGGWYLPNNNHGWGTLASPCRLRDSNMAYLLPRAVFVLIAWGMTCALIRKFWHPADPTIFGVVGASLVAVAGAYFGYLHKLRRDIEALERARGHINRSTRA
jgi:hypothetical protein